MFFRPLASPFSSMRSLVRAGLVAGVLAVLLCRPAPALAQDSIVEIYDARDLAALIAAPPEGQSVATEKPGTPGQPGVTMAWARTPGQPQVDRLDKLFGSIANVVGAPYQQIMPGVFAVTTDRATHDNVRAMLKQVREMSRQRYELELVAYTVTGPATPALGKSVAPDAGAPQSRIRTTVLRRLPQQVEAVKRIAYISDWMPVVADNAVGNDPTTSEVVSGLSCVALIGAGPDSPEVVNFQLTGRLTKATVVNAAGGVGKASAATGPASEGLGIGLPTVDERSMNVDMAMPITPANVVESRLTAIAVLPGFDEGQSIVIAAGVREIK